MRPQLLTLFVYSILGQLISAFSKNTRSSPRIPEPSKGFGSSNTKPSTSTSNPLNSLETLIQNSIDKCSGLREAMAIVDEIETYDLRMKYADGIEKIRMQTYAQDIENKRKMFVNNEFKGWNMTSIRNKLQEITWDNTAGIREQRHKDKAQDISSSIRNHMLQVARYTLHDDATNRDNDFLPTVLDVGCGTGITFQFLKEYTTQNSGNAEEVMAKCYGVDISKEMIQICRQKYPSSHLQNIEYSSYTSDIKFNSIVFNECIHNFPNTEATLMHAYNMLSADGGRIILSHPRGYENVRTQRNANKWLSPSLLPVEAELKQLAKQIGFEVALLPDIRSPQYLAVLVKISH